MGIRESEWPSSLQDAVFLKFPSSKHDSSRNLQVAGEIAKHIKKTYLYSVDARQETDPVEAVKAKAFQCDLAATVMLSILRDVYHIPSRIVGGFRAKKKGQSHKSYLVLPGEGHAWVEVYEHGKWTHFDPTPERKDKKDKDKKEEGEKDEYSDRSDETQADEEQAKEKDDNKADQAEVVFDVADQIAKDSKAKIDQVKEQKKEDKKPDESNNSSLLDQHLLEGLEIGSLELEPKIDHNPLLERAYRVFLKIALDPLKESATTAGFLHQTQVFFLSSNNPPLITLFQDALRIHEGKHPALAEWIEETQNFLHKRKPDITYKNLFRIHMAYELYSKTLDRDSLIKPPYTLLSELKKLLAELKKYAHKDSKDISIASQFYTNLPPLVQTIVKKKYGIQHIDHQLGTKNLAADLKQGKLKDFQLISQLSKHSDFILDANPRPEYRNIMSYERDLKKTTGNELMPLQRFSELPRALLPRPGASIEDNLRLGVNVATKRKRVKIPSGSKKEDDERITLLLYDISGSMSGTPADFQAGLIATFTAQAISDISPSGKHRHRVVLIPFDDKVHAPTKITNTQEAIDVIEHYRSKLMSSGGGTDIQKALLEALKLIAGAEKRQGEPLAVANIILMTDGEAEIKAEELLKARNLIDRNTPIQTMFISIGQSNNKNLIDFAQNSESFGFTQGFYREFSHKVMEKIMEESQKIPDSSEDSLYFDKKSKSLPREIIQLLQRCRSLAFEFSETVKLNPPLARAKEQLNQLQILGKKSVSSTRAQPLNTWI